MNELTELLEKKAQGTASAPELKRIAQLSNRAFWMDSLVAVAVMAIGLAAIFAVGTFAFRDCVPDGPLPWITWQIAGVAGAGLAGLIGGIEAITSRRFYLGQMTQAGHQPTGEGRQ